MKRTILFGILRIEIIFFVMGKDLDHSFYHGINANNQNGDLSDSVFWVDSGRKVTSKEVGDMPNLLDSFEAYLEAILPALRNGRQPEQDLVPVDYRFKSHADLLAWRHDDYYAPPRCNLKPSPGFTDLRALYGLPFEKRQDSEIAMIINTTQMGKFFD